MEPKARILVVEDQKVIREGLERVLRSQGHDVEGAGDAEAALQAALDHPPDLVILDLHLPGKDGLGLLTDLQERGIDSTVVVLTGHASIETAIAATRRGAFDYLEKPVEPNQFRTVVDRALERASLRQEVRQLRQESMRSGKLHQLIGRSQRMQELYRLLEQIAPTNASVLITGESGTGKEVIARTIHRMSPRAQRAFVAINCAAIPETLLESEVFGHERGAFTGATSARAGCFEQADGGTLFLDEIGDMPPDLQSKLLRVLEDKKFRRVGGEKELSVDVRVLAATNVNVKKLLSEGRFREDLYFRLNVFTLELPPLRDRGEDIPTLAEHFLQEFQRENSLRVTGFSDEALQIMRAHDWPGNVRDLRNAVQRAAILCTEGEIGPHHLPPRVHSREDQPRSDGRVVTIPVGTSIEDAERELIMATLRACGGKKPEASDILGISLKTLYTRLHKYDGTEADPGELT